MRRSILPPPPGPKAKSSTIARRKHRKRVARIVADHWRYVTLRARADRHWETAMKARALRNWKSGSREISIATRSASQRVQGSRLARYQRAFLACLFLRIEQSRRCEFERIRHLRIVLLSCCQSWRAMLAKAVHLKRAFSKCQGKLCASCLRDSFYQWRHLAATKSNAKELAAHVRFRRKQSAQRECLASFQKLGGIKRNVFRLHYIAQKHGRSQLLRSWERLAARKQALTAKQEEGKHLVCSSRTWVVCRRTWLALRSAMECSIAAQRHLDLIRQKAKRVLMRRALSHLTLGREMAQFAGKRRIKAAIFALRRAAQERHAEAERKETARFYAAKRVGRKWLLMARGSALIRRRNERRFRREARTIFLHMRAEFSRKRRLASQALSDWRLAAWQIGECRRVRRALALLAWRRYRERKANEEELRRLALRWRRRKCLSRFAHHWRSLICERKVWALEAWKGPFLSAQKRERERELAAERHREVQLGRFVLSGWVEAGEAERKRARLARKAEHCASRVSAKTAWRFWRKALCRKSKERKREDSRARRAGQQLACSRKKRVLQAWKANAERKVMMAAFESRLKGQIVTCKLSAVVSGWKAAARKVKEHVGKVDASLLFYDRTLMAKAIACVSANALAARRDKERAQKASSFRCMSLLKKALRAWHEAAEKERSDRERLDKAISEYHERIRKEAIARWLNAGLTSRYERLHKAADRQAVAAKDALQLAAFYAQRWLRKALPNRRRGEQCNWTAPGGTALTSLVAATPLSAPRSRSKQGYSSRGHSRSPSDALSDVLEPIARAKQQLLLHTTSS